MSTEGDLRRGYELLLEELRSVSENCTEDMERVRLEGSKNPMSDDEVRRFLGRCLDEAGRGARSRGDVSTATYLETEKEHIMERVLEIRKRDVSGSTSQTHRNGVSLSLKSHQGIQPHPLRPSPVFHGRSVPVNVGFVDVRDIRLWRGNRRLNIHVSQFEKTHGRAPDSDDLLDIMGSRANLAGLDKKDQFKIVDLAKSIAASGVRQPPIIAYDGVLLDGNRRVAACRHILENDFSSEEKERAATVQVWRLTEHASNDEENAVVVSLNFEKDLKVEWPEYVKGQILYEEWRAMLEREDRPLGARQNELKRELARRYAITVDRCNRYIAMVELADDFEDYQRNERGKDAHEVKHRSNEYFQYFDELGKGRSPGGVNWSMNQDDAFRNLVFDLLHDGKFRNYVQIRDLRHAYGNEEAMDLLRAARNTEDEDEAQQRVDLGLSAGKVARAEERRIGGNKRVEAFVRWLREAPVEFFSAGEPGAITEENLGRLYSALKLVEGHMQKFRDPAGESDDGVPVAAPQTS